MWPSLETASTVAAWANFAFIASLVVGVVSTVAIVWMASVKEAHWDRDRAQLAKETARLSADAEDAKSKIAEANARAAEANEKAEAERLARVKIEVGLASRRLSSEQAEQLTAALTIAKERLPIVRVKLLGDKEANDFGMDIIRAIQSAGINTEVFRAGQTSPPRYGIMVSDTPDGILMGAFTHANVAGVAYDPTVSATPAIFIALKPPPF